MAARQDGEQAADANARTRKLFPAEIITYTS